MKVEQFQREHFDHVFFWWSVRYENHDLHFF